LNASTDITVQIWSLGSAREGCLVMEYLERLYMRLGRVLKSSSCIGLWSLELAHFCPVSGSEKQKMAMMDTT
jgi:hypothetical protein